MLKPNEIRQVGKMTATNGKLDIKKIEFVAGSLVEVQTEWSLFSPAIPYLYGKFTDAYFIDLLTTINQEIEIFYCRFDHPLFDGLVDKNKNTIWNYLLYVVSREYWQIIEDFFCQITQLNQSTGAVWGFGLQDVVITDPLYWRSKQLPLNCTVNVFGCHGNTKQLCLQPVPGGVPRLACLAPERKDVNAGNRLLNGLSPYKELSHEDYTQITIQRYNALTGGRDGVNRKNRQE